MAPWLTLPPLPLPPIPPLAVPREVRRMVRLTYVTALTTLVGYGIFLFFGYLRDLFRGLLDWRKSDDLKGYAPICPAFEDFYTRRIYHRIQKGEDSEEDKKTITKERNGIAEMRLLALGNSVDLSSLPYSESGIIFLCQSDRSAERRADDIKTKDCFGRPIASAPDAWVDVVERYSNDNNKTLHRTSNTSRCLNLGSYNYLGFAAGDEYCTPRVIDSLKNYAASTCGSRADAGTTKLHIELEELIARFVGKPSAITFGMGYVTNSSIIPALVGEGALIISDSFNHNSIVSGGRASGAAVQIFQHNSPSHLEELLREQIVKGQPGSRRPWRKIMVIVEGIYSMEGEFSKLPEIVAICKKYKAYIYLDEAHSIGAVGKSGRGVCELLGVDPADIDIMMGTFTKSFGSCGGYIAASEDIIQYLKHTCPAHLYATSMSPPAVQQVISALNVIIGEDGSNRGAKKLAQIRESSNFFRSELKKMGFVVLGDNDSPIMSVMLYNLAKLPAFSRECLRQNVAVVVVAYPATPVLLARARICVSASHTREDLIKGLKVISEVGGLVGAKCLPAEPEKAKKMD